MRFSIKSNKSKDEIIQILKTNTSERKGLSYRKYDEYFNGTVKEDSFKIQRNINYKNSFLPVIIGTIKSSENGTEINIKMRLNLFIKGFMIFWFTFVVLFCIITPFAQFDMPFCLIPYIMLIAGVLLVTIPGRIERTIAKEKLEELLQ